MKANKKLELDINLEGWLSSQAAQNCLNYSNCDLPMLVWMAREHHSLSIARVRVQQDYNKDSITKNNFCSVSISENPDILCGEWKLGKKEWKRVSKNIVRHNRHLHHLWLVEQIAFDKETFNPLDTIKVKRLQKRCIDLGMTGTLEQNLSKY